MAETWEHIELELSIIFLFVIKEISCFCIEDEGVSEGKN